VTAHMDAYDTIRSARALRDFVTDLSTWYVRRSRDRFKSGDADDAAAARMMLRHVLATVAKLTAPLTPFIAEYIYRGVGGECESVHMADWPTVQDETVDATLLDDMVEVRRVASLVLEARQRAQIKVRQPLSKVTLASRNLEGKDELLAILAEEVNVKVVVFGSGFDGEVDLDTELTPELQQEGAVRDVVRAVQDMRKKNGYAPEDRVTLTIGTDASGTELVEAAREYLSTTAGVSTIVFGAVSDGTEVKCGEGRVLTVAIEKVG